MASRTERSLPLSTLSPFRPFRLSLCPPYAFDSLTPESLSSGNLGVMSTVEQRYRESLGRWTGCQRVERTAAPFSEFRAMLLHKARIANPSGDDRALRLAVARSLYRSDPAMLKLISAIDD